MEWKRLAPVAFTAIGGSLALSLMPEAQALQPPPIAPGTCINVYSEPFDTLFRLPLGAAPSATVPVNVNVGGVSLVPQVTVEDLGTNRLRVHFDFGLGDTFQVFANLTGTSPNFSFGASDTYTGTGVFAGTTGTINFGTTGDSADYTTASPAADGPRVAEFGFIGQICRPSEPPPPDGGGGHTPGFWGNKNGQALIDAGDLAALVALNLVDEDGNPFDPATAGEVKAWLRDSEATNMAYKLSSHLAAMKLNVLNGFVDPNALVSCPTSVSATGEISIDALMTLANNSLGTDPYTPKGHAARAYQKALKDTLDAANNNLNWL